jgi:epoxyqueuosine reductase
MSDPAARTSAVLARCRELGFVAAGVARAEASTYGDELRRWLDAGKHGSMEYLAKHFEQRVDPTVMVPGARSVICVADRYADGRPDRRDVGGADPASGRVARYARGGDYHVVIRRRLEALAAELGRDAPQETFRVCVDTAPVLEREHAARAGLGRIGKNTLLIAPDAGSWLLLGEIITTMALEPTRSAGGRVDPCGSCTRCIDACPTQAISPWSVDASRCVSTLTIEHRGLIDEAFHERIGDWLFGCDVCQEVCPHNQPTRRSRATGVAEPYDPRRSGFDLLKVLGWTEDGRRDAFITSALKRAKLAMMKRNACIVAGNALQQAWRPELARRLAEIASDASEDEVVSATARQACARLHIDIDPASAGFGLAPGQ